MDPTPTTSLLAPFSSTAKTQIPPTPLERRVGEIVAMAACALAAGVRDHGLTKAPKLRAAALISELVELRRLMIPFWDFDALCHQYGRQSLIEACGGVSAGEQRILDELVNGTMEILRKVVHSELH